MPAPAGPNLFGAFPPPGGNRHFRTGGRNSPKPPSRLKAPQCWVLNRRSGALWKNSEPVCELFPMTPVLVETGQHKDQTIALPAGRHGRSRKRQAATSGRCEVVGWVTAPPPSLRQPRATAHAMGIAPRAATTLPADLTRLPRISANRATVSPSGPRGHCGSPCVDSLSSSQAGDPTAGGSNLRPLFDPPVSRLPFQEKAP